MSSSDIAAPASSPPVDRLALGVGLVRPTVASIGGALNPASWCGGAYPMCVCFEGNED